MRRSTLVVAGAIVASACMAGGAKHDVGADVAAIGKVRDAYMAAFNSSNAAAAAALYATDAHMMQSGEPTATGPQAIEASMKSMFGQLASANILLTAEKTDVDGDLGYDRGTWKTTMTPNGGPAMVGEGRYLVVLRRQPDGAWKLTEDIGNMPTVPPPMAMAAPAKPAPKVPPKKK